MDPRRSSASRLASSAPTERIAGPMRASSARSGPIANGTSVTTMRKNNTPINAPPPTRTASRMSRTRSAERAVIAVSADSAAQGEFLRPVQSDRSMGGGDDQSAAGEMGAHEIGQHRLRRRVKGRGRFIEQPDRPLDRDQPRKREAAPLSGGAVDRRQLGEPVEADGGDGGVAGSP